MDDLTGILAWVQKQKEANKDKPWGWTEAIVVGVIVLVAMAASAFSAWLKGREIAKLQHQIDVEEELRLQQEAKLKREQIEARQELIQQEIDVREDNIRTALENIDKLEQERILAHQKIEKITNWNSI